MVAHYEILANDPDRLIVKFNPAAFIARPVCFSPVSKSATLSFNCNYFYGTAPIGEFKWGDWKHPTIKSPGIRPSFKVGSVTIEAGPLLLPGKWRDSVLEGKYSSDTYRKTSHVVYGETEAGKGYVAWYRNAGMDEMAEDASKHCVRAMKCDGGGSAYLKVGKIVRGRKLYVGVEMEER